MNAYEIQEIVQNSKDDSYRLHSVATAIYRGWMFLIYFAAAIGGLLSIGLLLSAMSGDRFSIESLVAGIAVAIITIVFCTFSYAMAVISTHMAKVLANICMLNLITVDPPDATGSGHSAQPSREPEKRTAYQPAQPTYKTCSKCMKKVESWAQICPDCDGENFH